jgi:hypothetical protein
VWQRYNQFVEAFRGSQSGFPLLTPTMQAGQDSDGGVGDSEEMCTLHAVVVLCFWYRHRTKISRGGWILGSFFLARLFFFFAHKTIHRAQKTIQGDDCRPRRRCVECLIGKTKETNSFKITEPSSVPYGAPPACRSRPSLLLFNDQCSGTPFLYFAQYSFYSDCAGAYARRYLIPRNRDTGS